MDNALRTMYWFMYGDPDVIYEDTYWVTYEAGKVSWTETLDPNTWDIPNDWDHHIVVDKRTLH